MPAPSAARSRVPRLEIATAPCAATAPRPAKAVADERGADLGATSAALIDTAHDRAESWPGADGGVFALTRSRAGSHWLDLPGVMRLSFDDGGERVTAMPDAGVGAEAVAEAYQHFALPMVLQALGHEVLHASAVCSPRGVTAFCGDSGAGKSTIAHGLHRRGHAAWADDAVALDISPAAIDAVPLPFDARLRPASAELFGLGAAAIRLPVAAPPAPLPLLAVCVLTRLDAASGPPALERLAPAAAFAALLPHAFCFSLRDVARKRLMLERYLSLIARVPVFRLAFGTALDGVPAILDRLEPVIGAAGR